MHVGNSQAGHRLNINNAAGGAGAIVALLPTHLNFASGDDYDVYVLESTTTTQPTVDIALKTATQFSLTWVGNGSCEVLIVPRKANSVISPIG